MTEKEMKSTENKKASLKPIESTSIRSLKLDVALVNFIHNHGEIHGSDVRMKTIMLAPQFSLLSQTTIRNHLKSLCVRGVLLEDLQFHGTYSLDIGYSDWTKELAKYMEKIIGSDLYKTIIDSSRR